MKLHILSDLHLEFSNFSPPATDADVVILAGDIDLNTKGVKWAIETFKGPVIFVPGNHEFYGGSLGRTLTKVSELAKDSNVHVLDRESIVIDGVRFIGTTLWTDFRLTGNQPLAQLDALKRMFDYKMIRKSYIQKIKPDDILQQHAQARFYVEQKLEEYFSGKTVVVSHHAPSELSIHRRYRDRTDHLNAAYASRLDHLMGGELVALWVHGHTHDSFDYDIYGTRVVCNPRGYVPDEPNQEFDPGLVVEI